MNDKIKRFTLYNIFFLCAFCCLFVVLGLRSFANTNKSVYSYNGLTPGTLYELHFSAIDDARYGIYLNHTSDYNGQPLYQATFYSNVSQSFTGYFYTPSNSRTYEFSTSKLENYDFYHLTAFGFSFGNNRFSGDVPLFYSFEDLVEYMENGTLPELPYEDSLELDSFKVKTWGIGNLQVLFKSSFTVTWSDSRISTVQVIIKSSGGSVSFESSSSPFKQKFEPELYVLKKGDVVHLTATPYMSDGTYGTSLYYSFVFDDNVPGSNIYRKFTNTPYSDNTLTIPYTGVSGQPQSVTLPVDGVTTQNVYKVNYNPQTYEYGDLNLYEIYYSPVVVYPSDATDEEIDETQDVINNTYTTNNYYETTKNININFDVSFGDISGSDIQHGFDDFENFSNGFGGFISKLSSWVLALFPFLSPVVASAIVVMFGLIVLLAIIALVLKIASVIADLIPF